MYADSYLKAGIELQVKLTAAHNVPVFTYLFEYPGNGSKEFLGEPGHYINELFVGYRVTRPCERAGGFHMSSIPLSWITQHQTFWRRNRAHQRVGEP